MALFITLRVSALTRCEMVVLRDLSLVVPSKTRKLKRERRLGSPSRCVAVFCRFHSSDVSHNPTARIMTDTVNVFMTKMQGIWVLSTVATLRGSRNPSESAVQSAAASLSFKGTPSRGAAHVATRCTSEGISGLASNVFCLVVLFSQINYRVHHWSSSRINVHVRNM